MLFNRVLTTDGQVLIDLTNLSVTADTLLAGITAIDRYGEHITGTFNIPQLQEKTVTSNGVVLPDSGYDGLSKVTVEIANPVEISTEAEMNALLENGETGGVYKYTGETTGVYENGALYILEVDE